MIRVTLVTGAGKLERQKYDENAAKAVTSTLRALGFTEDRGASAIPECAGSFKLQHDTGKNLKTVVVFPRIEAPNLSDAMGGLNVQEAGAFLPEKSPESKIAHSSMNVFERMIGSTCPSWSQKKMCLQVIEDIRKQVQGLEEKLMQGTPLTDPEQSFYDSVSSTALEEKSSKVKELMQKQVDEGHITAPERSQLLSQVKERIQNLSKDISLAQEGNKAKRVENLTVAKAKAQERLQKLESTTPSPPHALKNEAEISKLRKELEPLLDLEEGAKGRLLTLKESQAIARKDDILSEIADLEVCIVDIVFLSDVRFELLINFTFWRLSFQTSSRGWFETDEAFEARVKASESAWNARRKQAKKKTSKPSTGAAPARQPSAANKWVTPSAAKPKVAPKAAKPSRGGGVFAAMMMDSDSD